MNRQEALLKLLALEPEREDRLALITGWGEGDTLAVLAVLKARGSVQTIAVQGHRMCYVPGSHDETIQQTQHQREVRHARAIREKRGAAGRKVANARRKASTQGESRAL